jgi:hypothetical protein
MPPPAKSVSVENLTDTQLADEFGELARLVDLFDPTQRRFEAARKEIDARFAEHPADQAASLEGSLYSVRLTARSNRRSFTDKVKAFTLLRRAIGLKALIELITIPLEAAVDEFIPRSKHALFLAEERTGYRRISAVAKVPAANAAEAA